MSAESDLLFHQVDSFMLSDLSSFSEYEDFSEDIFIMNDLDGAALLEDADCRSRLKTVAMLESSDFSSSLEGIKEEDEEEDTQAAAIKVPERAYPSKQARELLQEGKLKSEGNGTDGLCNEETAAESIVSEVGVISSRTMASTEKMEEDLFRSTSSGNSWHASRPTLEQVTPIRSSDGPSLAQGNQIVPCTEASVRETCGIGAMQLSENSPALVPIQQRIPNGCRAKMMNSLMQVDTTMPRVAPPIFQIDSPLSSPSSSVSTPDGSPLFKMFGHEEAGVHKHRVVPVDLDTQFHQADHSSRAAMRHHHVAQDVSSLSTMPRSRSSHALGQFRTPGQRPSSCQEELRGASMQMPAKGYSNVINFTHYPASSSPALAESSPAAPMRRVFSTGDIQVGYGDSKLTRLERINSEEHIGMKVGHYTVEERRVRLDRYRQKRNERNFSKKIKYACRKTLADSRLRIRGRFARTLDDFGEPLLRENGTSYDDDYEEVDGLSGHCSVPNGGTIRFWNATGINGGSQHGH